MHPRLQPPCIHPGATLTELRGWRSNHLPPGGPLAWSTAQAVRCLARVHGLTRALINADVLASLGGRGAARPAAAAWDRLLDSDLASADGDAAPTTLKVTVARLTRATLTVATLTMATAYCTY